MIAASSPCDTMPDRAPEPRTTPTVPLDEERAVVARVRDGDRTAFAILYGWYGDAVYRAILGRLPDPVTAEDCLRDTFRTALERLDTFEHRDRSIYWWLRRIGVNKAMDAHRRRARDQRLSDAVSAAPAPAVATRPDRGLEQADTARDVGISLSRLTPRYEQVLRMRLLEDRSREDCARALGITVGNLDVILHRACKAFRKVYPP
jgi:RNA polymerase sigma factor (sigma-70 family)